MERGGSWAGRGEDPADWLLDRAGQDSLGESPTKTNFTFLPFPMSAEDDPNRRGTWHPVVLG